MDGQNTEKKLSQAFKMMWGKYPESVRLIRKDFTIIAANEMYDEKNGAVGTKCNAVNPEAHKGCQAHEALKKQEAVKMDYLIGEDNFSAYWVPVNGVPDHYIHFADGYKKFIKKIN